MVRLQRCLVLSMFLPAAWCGATARPATLPLVFEPNRAGFVGRSGNYTVRLEAAQVEFRGAAASLRMRLVGGNPRARLEGAEPLPGKTSYYLGNDPRRWRTGIPQYGRVRYRGVYPGIDLAFYGSAGQLEYDLVVDPRADPGRVRLRFDGARRLAVEANGDLRIETRTGVLRQKKPSIYQEAGGARREVAGRYVVKGREVRFAVEGYDRGRPLVIDPVIVYATYFGGGGDEQGTSLAVDAAGNAYFTGGTNSKDYPAVPKAAGNGPHGASDVFVTKLDPTGQHILYSVILGGTGDEEAAGIAIDSAGNAYITGGTFSNDFPVLHAFQSHNKGASDAFVVKLDASGNLVYSTYLGGGQMQPCGCKNYHYGLAGDIGFAIVADSAGNAYVGGETWSADFPFTLGVLGAEPDHGSAFVAKFGVSGDLLFSTIIDGRGWDRARAIALGASGTIWAAGNSYSPNLPTTPGAIQPVYGGDGGHVDSRTGDGWVAKLNPAAAGGNIIVALTYLGGSWDDEISAIQPDSADNLYATGSTVSTDFPVTAGALQTKYGGGTNYGDGFIAKLNSTLTSRLYVTYFGGTGEDALGPLVLDRAGNLYVAGGTTSASLTPASLGSNPNALQPGYQGEGDLFLLELNPSGTSVLYFSYLGANLAPLMANNVLMGSLAMEPGGSLYLLSMLPAGMPVTPAAVQPQPAGGLDLYLMRVDLAANPPPANPVSITSVNALGGVAAIAQNTWIEIKGKGLAPADVGDNGWDWSTAPEFASGRMPTQVKGVSVKVNGKPAYVYWISPTQVNVLTPLDGTMGPVEVRLTNGANTSAPFTAEIKAVAPAFLSIGATHYILAQHGDWSLLGDASMSVPGYTFTPAAPDEAVVLYASGFGLPANALVDGSATQFGALPNPPVVRIGGAEATVKFAGVVMPGLYQINVVVPAAAAEGDNAVTVSYAGFNTPEGAMIAVRR